MWCRTLAVCAVLMLTGCATFPESIQLDDDDTLLGYERASAQPKKSEGGTVRWGGVVANVSNLPDATVLEMVYYPLKSYGRPIIGDESMGRFRVYVDGFLDPMVFQTGRSVTLVGEYIGTEEGSVGEHRYVFPTVKASSYHLWKEVDRVEVSSLYIWPYGSFWGWPYRPYHQRVIIRRSPSMSNPGRPGNTGHRPHHVTKPAHVSEPRPPKNQEK